MFCNALPGHCRDTMRLLMHKLLSECSSNSDCTNEPYNDFRDDASIIAKPEYIVKNFIHLFSPIIRMNIS